MSPHLIYTKSALLPALVSSQLHTQLEFQAVGTWWIIKESPTGVSQIGSGRQSSGTLQKIPSTREDVFADDTLSMRDKRSLMKFLRSIVVPPVSAAEPIQDAPLSSRLTTLCAMDPLLDQLLLALSLSYDSPGTVRTISAVSRIRRHIQSIGTIGAGFGVVMPKYGGAAEIAQVACRASAVGGAVYVLGRGLDKISNPRDKSAEIDASPNEVVHLELSDGEEINARFVAGCAEDFAMDTASVPATNSNDGLVKTVHSISIVSSPLEHLFPPTSEGGPVPAGAVVVYGGESHKRTAPGSVLEKGAVYMVAHSPESGECPPGQCKHKLPHPICVLRSLLF